MWREGSELEHGVSLKRSVSPEGLPAMVEGTVKNGHSSAGWTGIFFPPPWYLVQRLLVRRRFVETASWAPGTCVGFAFRPQAGGARAGLTWVV